MEAYKVLLLFLSMLLMASCGGGSSGGENIASSNKLECKHTVEYEDSNGDGIYDSNKKYHYDNNGNIEKLSTDLNNDGFVDNYIEYEFSGSDLIGEHKYSKYDDDQYELVSGKVIYQQQYGKKTI